ncbi:hypothetical protein [Acidipropionibacterium acidipropionici]|uniref:hypothetical protein n=1 Tax=Acidipropionibacterium acidipropionici TaxID=1748 RepID=UPI001E3DFB17|nr:hypothetical protein [Acidipropionibacterium acidipropionici]
MKFCSTNHAVSAVGSGRIRIIHGHGDSSGPVQAFIGIVAGIDATIPSARATSGMPFARSGSVAIVQPVSTPTGPTFRVRTCSADNPDMPPPIVYSAIRRS